MPSDLDFEKLVDAHHGALYRFALSLARNDHEAGDLVQETFYLWATRGHQLNDPTKVKSWLFTTLYRAFLAKERRGARFPHHELSEVERELPAVPPELPGRLDWQVLADCLDRLDSSLRGPVALFYLQDCPYNEIAEILDIPLGTVKSRISRGIARLQLLLMEKPPTGLRKGGRRE
jgi:RNA polymerase sigma-70 factor (ECF subfamily)